MSSKPPVKDDVFTLPMNYVLEQLEKTDEQMRGSRFLLQHFFESNERRCEFLTPLVVNILWANFGLVEAMRPFLEDPVYFDNPDSGEKEYMISESALLNLQSLMLYRHQAVVELSRYSCSVGIH
jgi:hypothetical protein